MRIEILLLILALACVQTQGPAACEVAAYQDQGVAVTYFKPAFTEVRKGSTIDLYLEYQNLGESIARDVRLYDANADNLGGILGQVTGGELTGTRTNRLMPPDIEACVPGEIVKPDLLELKVSDTAAPGKEGSPVELALVYDYTTNAWADILTLSRDQWQVRREKDTLPETFEWVSAGPVKTYIEVPATPIVDDHDFLVKLYFTNELGGESYPTTGINFLDEEMKEKVEVVSCYPQGYEEEGFWRMAKESMDKISWKTFKNVVEDVITLNFENLSPLSRDTNCIYEVTVTMPKSFEYVDCDNCVYFGPDIKDLSEGGWQASPDVIKEGELVGDDVKTARRYIEVENSETGNLVLKFKGVSISSAKDVKDNEPHKYYLRFKLKKAPEVEEIYKIRVSADYTYYTKYSTAERIKIAE